MLALPAVLVLVSSASALVSRSPSCCFGLKADGGPGGEVGQLSDGQNRIGQGLPAASYCIGNGGLTDGNGRGCILTPPTSQFQCDAGASPTPGFAVGCNGTVTSNGNSTFYTCPTGDDGGYNLYKTPPEDEPSCEEVTLKADSCGSNCEAPSQPGPAPPPPNPTSCSSNLEGDFEFPHLIVKVDSAQPEKEYGTSFDAEVTPEVPTLFNFDIPASDVGKTCSLVFLFPEQYQLETSSYNLSGSGKVDFSMLNQPATVNTSYQDMPATKDDYGITTVAPGNTYTVATFECPAGQAVGFEMESGGGTSLSYFEDSNPSPIGLYITKC